MHVKTLRLETVYWCLNGTKMCIYMIREPIYPLLIIQLPLKFSHNLFGSMGLNAER